MEGEIILRNRLILMSAAVLAIVLIVAGCGGGSDSTTGDGGSSPDGGATTDGGDATTASITKAQLIAGADAVCTKGGKESEAEFASYVRENEIPEGKEPTEAQYAEIADEILVPALQQQVDEIRALGVPAEDEAQVEAILNALDEAIEEIEAADPKVAVQSAPKFLADAGELIQDYGFKVCGQGQ